MDVDLRQLFDRRRALSVPQVLAGVPASPGLYTIWIRSLDSLPPELVEYQRSTAKVRDLIYIGRATSEGGLKERLGRQDLSGKRNASFFRSVGVCMGFTPPALCIAPDSSNFRFSWRDREAIRLWLEREVVVNYAAGLLVQQVKDTEPRLIATYRPSLNIDNNPAASDYLKSLRKRACSVARHPGQQT